MLKVIQEHRVQLVPKAIQVLKVQQAHKVLKAHKEL